MYTEGQIKLLSENTVGDIINNYLLRDFIAGEMEWRDNHDTSR